MSGKFTMRESMIVSAFIEMYMMGLAIENEVETQEELDRIITENAEEITDLIAMFKKAKFPNTEITPYAFTEFTLQIFRQSFEAKTIDKIMNLMEGRMM
jgi:hypothetical protein